MRQVDVGLGDHILPQETHVLRQVLSPGIRHVVPVGGAVVGVWGSEMLHFGLIYVLPDSGIRRHIVCGRPGDKKNESKRSETKAKEVKRKQKK
jgi:hypothetical protein